MATVAKRIGYVLISDVLYEECYHQIADLFKYFKPMQIDFLYSDRHVKIVGISPSFDTLVEGEIIPQYEAVFTTEEMTQHTTVSFKRA